MADTTVRTPIRPAGTLLLLWLAGAALAGATGVVQRYPLPVPSLVLLLTGALAIVVWRWTALREWLWSLGPTPLVALHLTRFVGIAFLLLAARGELPAQWALPTGWGDIAVAALAVPLLLAGAPFRTLRQRRALLAWNILGVADMLLVVGGAIRLVISDPGAATVMQRLPMSLLPTFLVPLILVSHGLIFVWLRRVPAAAGSTDGVAGLRREPAVSRRPAGARLAGVLGLITAASLTITASAAAQARPADPLASVRLEIVEVRQADELLPDNAAMLAPAWVAPQAAPGSAADVSLAAAPALQESRRRRPSVVGGVVGFVVGAAAGGLIGCAANRDSYGVFCAGQNDTKVVLSAAAGGLIGGTIGALVFARER